MSDQARSDAGLAASDANAFGGAIDENLDATDTVLGELTAAQITSLEQFLNGTVTPDSVISISSTMEGPRQPLAAYPQQSGATQRWSQGDSGAR